MTDTSTQAGTVVLRRRDWPERLAELLTARLRVPFRWGSNDCALLAADAVVASTGFDLAGHLRGQYHTEQEAQQILEDEGGLQQLAATMLGEPMPRISLAQRGDIVLADQEGQLTLGVVAGQGLYAAPGPRGLIYRPLAECRCAWRV